MNRMSAVAYRHWSASLVNIAQANTRRNCELAASSFISTISKMSFSSIQRPSALSNKCLSLDNINPNYFELEYVARDPLSIRAEEIEKDIQQLLALSYDNSLFNSPDYPEDVKRRARIILDNSPGGSVGSYTDTTGIEVIRKQVARYIEKRDGVPCDWENCYLTDGAYRGIRSILALMCAEINGKRPGVFLPIPQYLPYSATLSEFGMNHIGYYLNEEENWSVEISEMERALSEARKTCYPRTLVAINPGNPTGQVLTHGNIVDVIKFAHKHKLLLLADEVYQENVWDPKSKFFSFKKVTHEMGSPYTEMELVSFMSTSKGYLGECGIRGGFMEIVNLCPQVKATLTKALTTWTCPNTACQMAVSTLVNPPEEGEPSYEQYIAEKQGVLDALKERAELVYKALKSLEGIKVNVVQGAMYAFPQISLPSKFVEAAKAKNMPPDTFYAFELLESTGICIASGSDFRQKEGTYHFRTTILPQTEDLKIMLKKFKKFHDDFFKRYK
ncbi:alanine aminotransferase 2-like isoform X2 [Eurosta solidaginis]|uniref:alanine aminotransferase 2-like isoform X2 n=1 Tax=Eurosta solidaginis TaxID=178769 RepID=UPI003531218D